MTTRDVFLLLGMLFLVLCTGGLILNADFHWLAWIDGQVVGVGLLVAASMQEAT